MYIETGFGVAYGDDPFLVGREAAKEALTTIIAHPVSVVIVFASIHYNPEKLLSGIRSITGTAPLIGTTTAGEIYGETLEKSVVVTVLASPYLTVRIGTGHHVSRNWRDAVTEALTIPGLLPFFSSGNPGMWNEITQRGKSMFAMLFSPGNTLHADSKSFEIVEELKQRSLGRIPIVGGSSADDWRMEANYIFSGREARPDSLLIALFETSLKHGIAVAHGFRASNRTAVITSAEGHEVITLDGRAAADVYAELLDTPKDRLEGNHLTFTTGFPLGIMDATGHYNLSVASYFTPRGGLRMTQPLAEGTTLTVMEPVEGDMILSGREAMWKAVLRSGISSPAIAIIFSCALRSRILKERVKEEIARAAELFPSLPVVGFYSFGEQGVSDDGISRHSNETVAALLLGDELSYPAQVAYENLHLRGELKIRIQESESTREALRDSEEKYRELVENANSIIYKRDAAGRILFINQFAQRFFGYAADEILGKNVVGTILPETDSSGRPMIDVIQDVNLFPEKWKYQENECLGKNGERIWIAWTNRTVLDENGNTREVLCIGTDISERRRADEEAKRYREYLEELVEERTEALRAEKDVARNYFDIAGVILIAIDRDQKVTLINKKGCHILGCEDRDVVGRNWFDVFVPEIVRDKTKAAFSELMAGNLSAAEYLENEIVSKNNERRLIAWHNTLVKDDSGNILGTLSSGEDITDQRRTVEELERHYEHLEELVKERAAELIRTNEKLQREIDERKELQRQLHRIMAEQAIILDNANVGISLVRNRRQVWVNRKMEEIFQYSKDELINQTTAKLYPSGEAYERLGSEAYSILGKGLTYQTEQELLRRDGTRMWVKYNGKAVDPHDMSAGILWILEDITEQRKAEEELKEYRDHLERRIAERTSELTKSEKKYKDLVDNSLVGIYKSNLRGDHLFVNEAMARIFDFESPEDILLSKTFERYKSRDDRKNVIKLLKETGKVCNFELEMVTRRGNTKFLLMNAILEGDVISGMMLDITDRKEFERDIELKSARLVELNTALKVLLEQREKDKNELESNISHNVKELVLPYIDNLRQRYLDEQQSTYLETLEKNLKNIVSPFMRKMASAYSSLTPAEIRVANLIREGKTAKEMARILCISETSVNTLKQRIRNKLGLTYKKINLQAYLASM